METMQLNPILSEFFEFKNTKLFLLLLIVYKTEDDSNWDSNYHQMCCIILFYFSLNTERKMKRRMKKFMFFFLTKQHSNEYHFETPDSFDLMPQSLSHKQTKKKNKILKKKK